MNTLLSLQPLIILLDLSPFSFRALLEELLIQQKILILILINYLMSDSESSQEIEVKVQLQHEAKVRELIEKGKTILPYYSEESLFHIYKQSFQNETNFLDKLHVIVRNQKISKEEGQQEWIYNKKHEKSQVNHRSHVEENRPKRQKYNFLEDKKLIERALKYRREDVQRERDNRAKNVQQYKPKPAETQASVNASASNVAAPLADKEKPQYKKEKANLYKEKKMAYKQKQVVPEPVKTQAPVKEVAEKKPVQVKAEDKPVESKPAPEPVTEKTEAKPAKYAQKKVKYAEKKEPAQTPKNEVNQAQKKVETTKAPEATKVDAPVNETKAPIAPKVEKKVEPKQQVPKVEPVKVEPASIAPTQAPVEVKTESAKKIVSQKDILSKAEVDSQFENSLSQNSFILKFIRPSNKLQQVSYIRYPDGRMADIKVKEPLDKKY